MMITSRLMTAVTRYTLLLLTGLIWATLAVAQQPDGYQEATKLFQAGQYAPALERVDNFLKTKPTDARARFLKGLILTEQNKPADAIRIFSALTADYPELPEPYNNLAVLYASQGQFDKARTELELAIRTHPSYATAHENLGDIYAKMASQAYDRALQLDKSNATALTKLQMIKELFTNTGGSAPAAAKAAASKPAPAPATQVAAAPAAKPAPAPAPAAPSVAAPPAATAPTPAAPAAKAVATPQSDNSEELIKTVQQWAKLWSDNNVAGYLAYYARDFHPPKGASRSAWEAERKARIAKPRQIDVQVEGPKVKFSDASHASVTFRQNYKAAGLKISSTKTLVMVKSGDRWLIQQERVGS